MSEGHTLDYFRSEVCELRKQMGDIRFWHAPPSKRNKARFAIGYEYINLQNADGTALSAEDNERAVAMYEGIMDEFNRRERMLLFAGKLNMYEEDEYEGNQSAEVGATKDEESHESPQAVP